MMRAPMLGCRQRRKARQLQGSRSWRLHQMHSRTHRHVSIGVLHSYRATYIAAAFLHHISDSNVPVQYSFPNNCTILHASTQELLHDYSETGVAYLDLSYYPTDALTDPGPAACVAGELKLVPGQFGMPSQVCHSAATQPSL